MDGKEQFVICCMKPITITIILSSCFLSCSLRFSSNSASINLLLVSHSSETSTNFVRMWETSLKLASPSPLLFLVPESLIQSCIYNYANNEQYCSVPLLVCPLDKLPTLPQLPPPLLLLLASLVPLPLPPLLLLLLSPVSLFPQVHCYNLTRKTKSEGKIKSFY